MLWFSFYNDSGFFFFLLDLLFIVEGLIKVINVIGIVVYRFDLFKRFLILNMEILVFCNEDDD